MWTITIYIDMDNLNHFLVKSGNEVWIILALRRYLESTWKPLGSLASGALEPTPDGWPRHEWNAWNAPEKIYGAWASGALGGHQSPGLNSGLIRSQNILKCTHSNPPPPYRSKKSWILATVLYRNAKKIQLQRSFHGFDNCMALTILWPIFSCETLSKKQQNKLALLDTYRCSESTTEQLLGP